MKPIFTSPLIVILITISSAIFAQERIINRDGTKIDLGGGRKRLVLQQGQNYYKNGEWHTYDLDPVAIVHADFSHRIENDHTIYFPVNSQKNFRLEYGGGYVSFRPVTGEVRSNTLDGNAARFTDVWENADFEAKPVPEGIKGSIILKDGSAAKSFQFEITSDLAHANQDGRLVFSNETEPVIYIPRPYAVDSDDEFVPITFNVVDQGNTVIWGVALDTLQDLSGFRYPITIDPSPLTYQPDASSGKDVYLDGTDPGRNTGALLNITAQQSVNGLIEFTSLLSDLPDSALVDSAMLQLYVTQVAGSPSNYCYPLTRAWVEGIQTSGPGVANWDSADASTLWDSPGGDYNNAYGDTVSSASVGTWQTFDVKSIIQLWVDNTIPHYGFILLRSSQYETWRSSDYSVESERPKLTVYYKAVITDPLPPSLSLPAQADACTTLVLSCADTLNDVSQIYYAFKYTGGPFIGQHVNTTGYALEEGDTTIAHKSSWQNISLKNLIPNINYSLRCEAYWKDDHSILRFSSDSSLYTRAEKPSSLSMDYDTDSTLVINDFGSDRNPGGTWYSIYDTTLAKYVDLDGTHKVYIKWYTKSEWEGAFPLAVQGLTLGNTYVFKAKAMNHDSLETEWGNPVSHLVAIDPEPPQNLVLFTSNVMTLMWSANTEFQLKGYNVYRDTTHPPEDYDSLAFVAKPDTMYVDSTAILGVTYYYWLTAIDSQGVESGASDHVSGYPGYLLSIPDVYAYEHDTLRIPIVTSDSMTLDEIYSFQFHIGYDETVVQFTGFDTAGTLSSSFYTVQVHDSLGVVNIAAFDTVPIPGGNDTIIFLNFVIDVDTGSNAGHSDLIFAAALVDDDNNYIYTTDGRISVKGLVYGDPSLNDSVTIYDCSLVLQHNIAKKFLNGLQQLVADVSGNGLVTVYDASLILKYTIGLIDTFPAGDTLLTKTADPPAANAALNLVYSTDTENKLITVDIAVSGAGPNISAIALDVGYPASDLEYERYALTALTENFMAGVQALVPSAGKNGVVKIGLANGHALAADGKIIRLYFRIKENNIAAPQFKLLVAMLNETSLDLVTAIAEEVELPKSYELSQNYPNPFNPETEIAFSLPDARFVRLIIYNILGQEVKVLVNDYRDGGSYQIKWDGTNNAGSKVASGIFIYRFRAEDGKKNVKFEKVRKMVLLR